MPVDDRTVESTVTIHARPATVFRFFTDPERFARWWAVPGGGRATIEPRRGGAVRIEYESGDVMSGEVVAIEPERRFVMRWGYEGEGKKLPPSSTRVEVELTPVDAGTRVVLRHFDLPDEENRTGHAAGWRYYLSTMANECARAEFEAGLGAVIDAYFEAWNTDDDAARATSLERACTANVRLTDAFACVEGVETLAAHIANARRHMPPVKLATTPPALSHDHAKARWEARLPDGQSFMSGENVYRLAPDGRIDRIVGFSDA